MPKIFSLFLFIMPIMNNQSNKKRVRIMPTLKAQAAISSGVGLSRPEIVRFLMVSTGVSKRTAYRATNELAKTNDSQKKTA